MKVFMVGFLILLSSVSFAEEPKAAPAQAPAGATASNEDQITSDIQKLINLTGGEKMGQQMLEQMILSMRQSGVKVPDEFWTEFLAESDIHALTQKMIPIYRKFLTHQQIKDIIVFYQSSTGQHLLEVMPKLMEESYLAGQDWGKDVSDRVREKLTKKGYLDATGKIIDPNEKSANPTNPVPAGSPAAK